MINSRLSKEETYEWIVDYIKIPLVLLEIKVLSYETPSYIVSWRGTLEGRMAHMSSHSSSLRSNDT